MSDDYRSSSYGQFFESLLNLHFGHVVERARRLVQNENRRIFQKRPRYGNTLFLTARKFNASLADVGVVAVFEALSKLVNVGVFRHFDNLFVRRVEIAVGDIVPNRSAEYKHVLRDRADIAP